VPCMTWCGGHLRAYLDPSADGHMHMHKRCWVRRLCTQQGGKAALCVLQPVSPAVYWGTCSVRVGVGGGAMGAFAGPAPASAADAWSCLEGLCCGSWHACGVV
jgi:hypothetical protein